MKTYSVTLSAEEIQIIVDVMWCGAQHPAINIHKVISSLQMQVEDQEKQDTPAQSEKKENPETL